MIMIMINPWVPYWCRPWTPSSHGLPLPRPGRSWPIRAPGHPGIYHYHYHYHYNSVLYHYNNALYSYYSYKVPYYSDKVPYYNDKVPNSSDKVPYYSDKVQYYSDNDNDKSLKHLVSFGALDSNLSCRFASSIMSSRYCPMMLFTTKICSRKSIDVL